jgi:hypothetical protein
MTTRAGRTIIHGPEYMITWLDRAEGLPPTIIITAKNYRCLRVSARAVKFMSSPVFQYF